MACPRHSHRRDGRHHRLGISIRRYRSEQKIFVTLVHRAEVQAFSTSSVPWRRRIPAPEQCPAATGGTVGGGQPCWVHRPHTSSRLRSGGARASRCFPATTADGSGLRRTPILRIEILEDKTRSAIQHHHLHSTCRNSRSRRSRLVPELGAKSGMRGNFQAGDIPGANLTFSQADGATVTTKGLVLDHIGFD